MMTSKKIKRIKAKKYQTYLDTMRMDLTTLNFMICMPSKTSKATGWPFL